MKSAIRIALTLAVLVLVWASVDAPAVWQLLRGASPVWLLVAACALTAQTLLSAVRWRLTAAQLGQIFGLRHAIREVYLAQLVNMVLPGGILGDAGRALRARHRAGLASAGLAVMLERLSGQVGLLAFLLAGVAAALLLPGGPGLPRWAVPLTLGMAAVAGAIGVLVMLRLPGRAGSGLRTARQAAQVALLAPGVVWRQTGLSLATAALNLLAFAAATRAIGTVLPLVQVLVLVPLILTAMLIPLSVAGWGPREAAAAALFPLAAAPAPAGVAASIAFGGLIVLCSLPGLWVLLRPDPATTDPHGTGATQRPPPAA